MWNINFQMPANEIQPTSTNYHIINQHLSIHPLSKKNKNYLPNISPMRDPGGASLSSCKAFVATLGAFSLCPGRTKLAFLANSVAPRAPSPKRLKRKARPKVGIDRSRSAASGGWWWPPKRDLRWPPLKKG